MADAYDQFAERRRAYRETKGAPPPSSADPEFDRLCASVLASGPGRELMAALRERTVERRLNAGGLGESALRVLVAESQFVLRIEDAIRRGLEAMTKGKTA